MSTEQQGDIKETETPAASPAEEKPVDSQSKPEPQAPASGGETPVDRADDSKEEPMIPKSRFDEALQKERSKREEELLNLKRDMDAKLSAAASSLKGEEVGELPDKDISELAKKYGVDEGFLKDFGAIYTARAEKKFAETLKPLQTQQQQSSYNGEFSKLIEAFPEAGEMTSEEKEAFKKKAFEPAYTKTSLSDLWRITEFDKPQGQRKTVESGRGGGTRGASKNVDISTMTNEEFLVYGKSLETKKS